MLNEKYKEMFISEAREYLANLDAGLVKFEKNPKDEALLKELMRNAHTLKGIAATAGYGEISNLTHSFEGMVENMKNDIATGNIDTLLGAVDELARLVDVAENTSPTQKANPLVDEVGELEKTDKEIDKAILEKPNTLTEIKEVKVRTEKIDAVLNIVAELTLNKMLLKGLTIDNFAQFEKALEQNAKLVDALQYSVMQMRLTPLGQIVNRFPRMVRDLSKKLDKSIEFSISGEEIELDRDILDNLGEPLVHLLRNSIDHGIEKEGKVEIIITRSKNDVLIQVRDNGKGIDWDALREKAGTTQIKDKEDLLFLGNSTAKEVTDVSGRGVGLYTVKRAIEKSGGGVKVESELGKGTTFTLKLPISMAIIKAIIFETHGNKYAVPISDVHRLIDLTKYELQSHVDQPFIVFDNIETPVIELGKILKTQEIETAERTSQKAILIKTDEGQVCYAITKVVSQEDIVVKTLAEGIREHVSFSAVTILGDGKPVPILDLETLRDYS